jgi:hypothetical protein
MLAKALQVDLVLVGVRIRVEDPDDFRERPEGVLAGQRRCSSGYCGRNRHILGMPTGTVRRHRPLVVPLNWPGSGRILSEDDVRQRRARQSDTKRDAKGWFPHDFLRAPVTPARCSE